MTSAFDQTTFIGAEQLELRSEAQVLVFADSAARAAAADVFPDHICISVVGAVDQAEWIRFHGRRVIACGDEIFCDRVADFAEIARFSARVIGPGEDPKNAREPAPFGDRLVRRTRIDASAPFDPLILGRLVDMPPADYERLRARLRAEAGFTRLGALDEAVKQARNADDFPGQDESQIDKLLAFTTKWECFASPHEKPFVSFVATRPDGGTYIETLGVRSKKLRLSLVHKYFLAYDRAPGDAALRVVADTLEAQALFSGSVQPVFIRRGWRDGVLYLDRGTEDRSAYRVSAGDWRSWDIVPSSAVPVKFIRVPGMLPLAEAVYRDPKEGLLKLREVTRFQTDRDEIVVVGFILHGMGGRAPYSVLAITGEPGSAKTALVLVIGRIMDPSSLLKGTALSTKRDLYIAGSTRAIVVLNNVSSLSKDISDAACTVTEGGVDRRRALYTDDEESSIHAEAPIIITSIEGVITEGDLNDRTRRVELAPVPRDERFSENEFQAKLDAVAPVIMGAMLGALCVGLQRLPGLKLKDLPRLAEFATFVSACETAFWNEGDFLRAFDESAAVNADEVLLGDPVTRTLHKFMVDEPRPLWRGTATELLKELEAIIRKPERDAANVHALAKSKAGSNPTPDQVKDINEAASDLKEAREHVHTILDAKWPRAANALSNRLRLLGPQLRATGIFIKWPNSHREGRILQISYVHDPLYVPSEDIKGRDERSSPPPKFSASETVSANINVLYNKSKVEDERECGDDPRAGDDPQAGERDIKLSDPDDLPYFVNNEDPYKAPAKNDHNLDVDEQHAPRLHDERKVTDI